MFLSLSLSLPLSKINKNMSVGEEKKKRLGGGEHTQV